MRTALVLVCVLLAAGCGASREAPRAPERPVRRAVVEPVAQGRSITFVADGAWVPMKRGGPDEPIVLQHADVRGAAIGLFFEQAELGSSVEDTLNRWAMVMLSGGMVFRVTGVTNPVYPSETEGSFTMEGEDKGVPMVAECRVIHLGDPTADYWVLIFTVAPASAKGEAFAEADRIAKELKLIPPS